MTDDGSGAAPDAGGPLPRGLPDPLVAPLVDMAGEVLKDLPPADIPPSARRLATFDRRGLATPAARAQLRRLLDIDDRFRVAVVERFLARPEVASMQDGWDAAAAARRVAEEAASGRLPLLASLLCAARPPAWEFGLGLTVAAFESDRRLAGDEERVRALESQVATVEEARRRAEDARAAAEAETSRLEAELRDERGARRTRDQQAAAELAEADRRVKEARAALADAERRVEGAEARAAREVERATRAEERAAAARRAQAEMTAAGSAITADRAALMEAAEAAARLAGVLESLLAPGRALGDPAAAPPPPPGRPEPAEPRPAAPRRAPVRIPPGMMADTVEAAEAMVRTPGVVVIVDGYNVSMSAWAGMPPAEQRERLCDALAELHLRARCQITVVFDGAEVPGVRPPRRPGVQVVFSAPGQEADDVVVAQVSARRLSVPVIVVSSDGWVRAKAQALGAQALLSDVFLSLLRR